MLTRWVCTEKDSEKGRIVKARLVARGFVEDNSNVHRDPPTCCKESLHLALVVIASNHWEVKSLDIQLAFLQGISKDLFIKLPPEPCTAKIWKLQKCVYGLVDASHRINGICVLQWNQRSWMLLKVFMMKLFSIIIIMGNWKVLSQHMLMIFSGGGTPNFKKNIIDMMKKVFQISKENQNNFTYLGLHIKQNGRDIDIDQEGYISDINPIVIEDERSRKGCEEITTSQCQQLRAVIGQLNWVLTQTRPDVAYDTCIPSVSVKEARVKDLFKVNKTTRELQSVIVSV